MPKKRSWTDKQLIAAVLKSKSYRAVLIELQLIPAGGNYDQLRRRIKELNLNTSHFTGMGWKGGRTFGYQPRQLLKEILIETSYFQSYKLKNRLFRENIKKPECEMCGWHESAPDGRIPVELDHINGNKLDNRIENLRILCPNCHSLQTTHRGRNKRVSLTKRLESST